MRNLPAEDAKALCDARHLLTEVLVALGPDFDPETVSKVRDAQRLVREAMS